MSTRKHLHRVVCFRINSLIDGAKLFYSSKGFKLGHQAVASTDGGPIMRVSSTVMKPRGFPVWIFCFHFRHCFYSWQPSCIRHVAVVDGSIQISLLSARQSIPMGEQLYDLQ